MNINAIIEEYAHHFLNGLKTEYAGDKQAAVVIEKYLQGKKISEAEENILKTQLMDSLKIVGIGIPFVLIPGASILMPILIKVAASHHIELMPSAFSGPENTEQ
ncbi:MAG: hypothetical protein JST09_05920 [Bacteroidetes bacterium]|nr:hypothetical protein [Bacteroidota bacterium]MBS1610840.1 hypothetical protein [Bacteroidota bacterium]